MAMAKVGLRQSGVGQAGEAKWQRWLRVKPVG